ncbi:hypothetical protein MKW94_029460 [Papaver nudicaule]|uniref:F-box domain-containing protein n=1 Tax=Papaver nudicaule TaxID=74823 RepID=A0AA41UXD2_PAPNU|nr:hypothetical protein [Papaver nudicaule]
MDVLRSDECSNIIDKLPDDSFYNLATSSRACSWIPSIRSRLDVIRSSFFNLFDDDDDDDACSGGEKKIEVREATLLDIFWIDEACKIIIEKLDVDSVVALSSSCWVLYSNKFIRRYLRIGSSRRYSNLLDDTSMLEILSNLPVKSLTKFKCVSKNWKSLFLDSDFIQLHLSKSQLQLFVMMYKTSSISVYTTSDGFGGGQALLKVKIPWSQVFILEPIHGLFCFIDMPESLSRVYNVATQESTSWLKTPLPLMAGHSVTTIPTYGFGFDPDSGKHKILCIWEIARYGGTILGKAEHEVQVLTVGEKEWRIIDEVPPIRPFGAAVYANGSIYRRNRGDNFFEPPNVEAILAFDIGKEKFRVIPIPDEIINSHRFPINRRRAEYLLQVDGHLAIIDRLYADEVMLWISDDDFRYQTERKWSGQRIKLPFPCLDGERLYIRAIEGTKQLIFKPNEATDFVILHIYNRDTNKFLKIKISDLSPSKRPFIYGMITTHETLLPVQKIEEIDD